MNRFNNVIIGQKAFILNGKNEVLILKRQNVDINQNFWDIPGGKVESEDTLFESLSREIKEETNLEMESVLLILSSNKFEGSLDDHPVVVRNIYLVRATGEFKISQEHSDFKWIKPEDLNKYDFSNEEDIQHVVKNFSEIIKSNNFDKSLSILF